MAEVEISTSRLATYILIYYPYRNRKPGNTNQSGGVWYVMEQLGKNTVGPPLASGCFMDNAYTDEATDAREFAVLNEVLDNWDILVITNKTIPRR